MSTLKQPRRARVLKPRAKEESRLLADIRIAVGARADFLVTRINTGVYAAPGKPRQRIRSAPNGFPDLIGTQLRRVLEMHRREHTFGKHEEERVHTYGQTIAIETKAKDGELSDEQRLFRRALEAAGGIYIVARSVDDVLAVLGDVPEWVLERRRR